MWLASGGYDKTIRIWDVQSRKCIRKLKGYEDFVYGLAFSKDSEYSGSSDQTIRLWNIRTGELLINLFIGSDREWVVWTPEGYYKSSPKGDQLIGWHINCGWDKAAEYRYAYPYENAMDSCLRGNPL